MRLLSKLCLLVFFLSSTFAAFSQVAIGTGANAPNPDTNAVLLLEGNGSQGIIIPKVASLGTFGKPGMIVYNTATGTVHYFNTTWVQVGSGAGGTQGIQIVGNKVLIGTGAGFSTEFSIANTAPTIQGQILMWDTSLNSGAGGWTSSANTAPSTIGQVLKWNGSRWEPGTDNTGSAALPLGQIFVGNSSNVATATAPSAIALNNFGAPTADVPFGNRKITNLAAPTLATDAATKAYVDGITPTVGDNTITGGSLGAGVKIAANTITDANINTLANIAGTKVNPAFGTQNITTTTGSASIGGGLNVGLANGFTINNAGNITRINNIATSFPSTQGLSNTYLRNDGSGNLSWSPVAGGSDVTAQSGVLIGNGSTITGLATGTNNQVLTVNAGVPTWQNIPILNQNTTGTAATATALATGRTITLTGDVGFVSPSFDGTGNISGNATVAGLRGRTIANTLPVDGQVLKWNNTLSQWEPAADAVGGGGAPTLTPGQIIVGDGTTNSAALIGLDAQLNSTNGNITVRGLQGRPISNAVPLNNSVYQYDGTQWAPVVLSGITNPMTAPNDLIVGGAAGAAARLAAPGNNELLSSNGSGAVTWVPQSNFVSGVSQAANLVLASPNGSAGLPVYRQLVDADIAGTIAGNKIVPDFLAQNISTTGTLTTGTAGAFAVDAAGNITKINGATTSFPATNAAGVLTNNGTGTLTWSAGGSGWGLTGNAGTLPATNFVGTTDAQDLVFRTNNTEYARITSLGKVGFGTATPSLGFLEVNSLDNFSSFSAVQNGTTGNAIFAQVNSGSATGAGINVNQNGNGFGITSLVNNASNPNAAILGSHSGSGSVIIANSSGTGSAASLNVNNAASPATALSVTTVGTGPAATFTGGNVGIGTATPGAKLDIVGNIKIVDGTQGAGKILTSDASGLASWQPATGGGNMFTTNNLSDLTNFATARTNLGLGSVAYTWPASNGTGVLTNNGSGTLTWSPGGAGSVTTVSVTPANGFTGSVATASSTPAITIGTSLTGVLKGNGTALSVATGADLPAMTATVGGAVPTPPNNTTTFLRGDGIFATPAGGGTVTTASVVSANGFSGTVATPTSTPAITIGTSLTGLLRGNGTGLAVATGADLPPMTATVGGAVPTPPNNTTTFLRGDGIFATPAGGGTVTTASVVSANGFSGTVATATTTPAITIGTSLNGLLRGNGTGLALATAGTDYQAPLTLTTAGTSGAATLVGNTLNVPNYAGATYLAGTGLTLTTNTFSVNTSQNISTLSNLTTNGLIKTSGGTGALSIATAGTDYLTPTGSAAGLTGLLPAQIPSLDASKITTGALPITNGGTGATTAPLARTALGLGTLSTLNLVTNAEITDGTIADADVNASANIAGTKIAPSFGAQNIVTTGTLTTGTAGAFAIDATGNITKIRNVTTVFPAAQGVANSVLTNDGAGNLTWAAGSGWSLTGNGGTVDGTNFIGTTDFIPLNFRVGGLPSGRIDPVAIQANTFFGYSSGSSNTGAFNTGFGFQSLQSNTGTSNTAFGSYSMVNNSSGFANTGVGRDAMRANTTGAANTAVGVTTLYRNTTGNSNTALGGSAMFENISGAENVALGNQALQLNTAGIANTATGFYALLQNQASNNVAMGWRALESNNTGAGNTAIGTRAGYTAITANANVSGSNNTFLGFNSGPGTTTQLTNAMALGANALVSTDNTIQLGNSAVTTVNVGTGTTAKLVAGQLQITGGTLAAGRVLTSDASGNATWQPGGGGGLVNNTGTRNLFAGSTVPTVGADNAIFGELAGNANTGSYNVIMGSTAAFPKTTGDLNVIIGWNAGRNGIFQQGNTYVGAESGNSSGASTLATLNSFFGERSGFKNTTGAGNTFIGDRAGAVFPDVGTFGNTTGSDNTALGTFATMEFGGLTNATAIGMRAMVSQSNSLVLGSINGVNGATATVNVGIGTSSPTNRLHINEPSTAGNFLRITNNPSPNGLTIGLSGAGSQEAFIANNQNAAMYFQTNATNRMTITAGGNIGIGTISPNAGLQFANVLGNRRLVLWESVNNDHEYYGFGVNGGEFRYQIPNNAGAQHRFYAATSSTTSLLQMSIGANGNVAIAGSLSKGSGTFKIDHPQDPENKYLYHSFVESPDMMNVYNGNITTDVDGNATVELPGYFESLNKDFRYQLTVIGAFAQAIIGSEVKDNKFVIRTDKANVKVSWQVTGIRKDPYAEQNRVVPEVEKPANEKGKYLHPEAYGLPLDKSVNQVSDKKENN